MSSLRKKGGAKGAEPSASEPPPSSEGSARKKGKGGGGWPTWLYVTAGAALVVSVGRVFLAEPAPSTRSRSRAAAEAEQPGEEAAAEETSTSKYLQLMLKLQEMTELASALQTAGGLDAEAMREIDRALSEMEEALGDEDQSSTARDIRSMVSVVRGISLQNQQGDSVNATDLDGKAAYTYADPFYWEQYYNHTQPEERYDWYGSWNKSVLVFDDRTEDASTPSTIGELLKPHLTKESRILVVGCGSSDVPEHLYMEGYQSIVNIDISERLLEHLRSRLAERMPKMQWHYMNASALTFDDATFDVVLDKGTFDALEQDLPLLQASLSEAFRTLRPGGLLLSVTFRDPEIRVKTHIQPSAPWGPCNYSAFDNELTSGQWTRYYVNVCRRPPED